MVLGLGFAVLHSCKNHPQGDCCAEEDTLEHIKAHDDVYVVDAALLKGSWTEAGDSATAFAINDSIRYNESPGVAYPYSLKNDSLFISIENIPFSARIIKVTTDSLVLGNSGVITRYSKKGQ